MDKKVILVTGASAGIGGACADRLAQAGWTVIGASRRGTSSGAWRAMTMNVNDDNSVSQGVADVLAEHGRIDAVLASAGWGLAGAAEQTSIGDAKAQFETNFWGAVRLVHAVLPILRHQGGGRIVLMSSNAGQIGIPYQAFYSASKFALEGYAESLAYEVEPFGVHVTLVEPGNFTTDFMMSRRTVQVPSDDPYETARDKALVTMEGDEVNGADPRDVAKVVERVLGAAKPPRRTSVGTATERAGLIAKRLMPFALFERLARGGLGV